MTVHENQRSLNYNLFQLVKTLVDRDSSGCQSAQDVQAKRERKFATVGAQAILPIVGLTGRLHPRGVPFCASCILKVRGICYFSIKLKEIASNIRLSTRRTCEIWAKLRHGKNMRKLGVLERLISHDDPLFWFIFVP